MYYSLKILAGYKCILLNSMTWEVTGDSKTRALFCLFFVKITSSELNEFLDYNGENTLFTTPPLWTALILIRIFRRITLLTYLLVDYNSSFSIIHYPQIYIIKCLSKFRQSNLQFSRIKPIHLPTCRKTYDVSWR